MDRHFLIAVSDQKSALNGVRFVGDFFVDKSQIKATLFYSTPKAPLLSDSEKSLSTVTLQKHQEEKLLAKGEAAVQNAGRLLIQKGFLKENLIYKARTQVFSKVADIIQEGEKGAYDAVVLGRRGISMIEEAFDESVSSRLFKEKISFPLWLCNAPDGNRKDVLLYLDGSEASFTMADHVGFILAASNRHCIDILAPDSVVSDSSLMGRYTQTLAKNGLDTGRIRKRTTASGHPAKDILKLVEKTPYASVAVGKAPGEETLLSRLFKGVVCSILFREMKLSSLWLCQ